VKSIQVVIKYMELEFLLHCVILLLVYFTSRILFQDTASSLQLGLYVLKILAWIAKWYIYFFGIRSTYKSKDPWDDPQALISLGCLILYTIERLTTLFTLYFYLLNKNKSINKFSKIFLCSIHLYTINPHFCQISS
jgi:hypothetical protein